jgi:hypothetical protein
VISAQRRAAVHHIDPYVFTAPPFGQPESRSRYRRLIARIAAQAATPAPMTQNVMCTAC